MCNTSKHIQINCYHSILHTQCYKDNFWGFFCQYLHVVDISCSVQFSIRNNFYLNVYICTILIQDILIIVHLLRPKIAGPQLIERRLCIIAENIEIFVL